MALSSAARDQVNRMLRGRPPSGRTGLNEAIDYVNARPELRAVVEGAAPTGLSAEGLATFKEQEAERLGIQTKQQAGIALQRKLLGKEPIKVEPRQAESTRALGQLARTGRKTPVKEISVSTTQPTTIDISRQQTRQVSAPEVTRGARIFVPGTGFLTPQDISGQGTATIDFGTPQEQQRIIEAEFKGSIPGIQKKSKEIEFKLFGKSKVRDLEIEQRTLKEQFKPLKVFDVVGSRFVEGGELIVGKKVPAEFREQTKTLASDIFMTGGLSTGIRGTTTLFRTADLKVGSLISPIGLKTPPTKFDITLSGKKGGTVVGAGKSKFAELELEKFQAAKGFTRKDVLDLLRKPVKEGTKFKTFGEGTSNFVVKAERARGLLRTAKGQAGKVEARKLIEEAYGKQFLKEFEAQEGSILFTPTEIRSISQLKKSRTTSKVTVEAPQTVFGTPSKFAGTGQFEKTSFVSFGGQRATTDTLAPKTIPITTSLPKVDFGFKSTTFEDVKPDITGIVVIDFAEDTKTTPKVTSGFSVSSRTGQITAPDTVTAPITVPDVGTIPKQIPKQDPVPRMRVPPVFGFPRPIPIKPIPRLPELEGGFKKRVRQKKVTPGKQQGYHGEVLDRGKWLRATKKARAREQALAVAGRVADNTTAVSIRVRKAKQAAVKMAKIRLNRNKFRDYKIKNGKIVPLVDKFIEKKAFRIDTLGEKRQLTAAKYLKGRKPKKNKTKRKGGFLFGGF